MKLVFITQCVDSNDAVVGFITSWIKTLASKIDYLYILTLRVGKINLDGNVFIYNFKRKNRILTFLVFNKMLLKIILKERINVIFSHMCPIYALLSAPYAKVFRIKHLLWYAHRKKTLLLKLATLAVDNVITSSKESFKIKSKKVRILSQGIEIHENIPKKDIELYKKKILSVGRITPIKDYKTLVKAADILINKLNYKDITFDIVGKPVNKRDYIYLEELKDMINHYKMGDKVRIIEGVGYNKIYNFYKNNGIFINLCPTGAPDKAVFEAMSWCMIILVCNKVFKDLLKGVINYDFLFEENNAFSLAKKLENVLSLPTNEIYRITHALRNYAKKNHSIDTLMNNLIPLISTKLSSSSSI